MIKCPSHINFLINPEDLHVSSNMNCMGNTTPAGVEQPMFVMHFYKYAMPPASVLAVHRNKLLAEAFYLRGEIEKFGTGYFRIQSELQHSPELTFKVESFNGFTRSGLDVTLQDTAQDTAQVRDLILNIEGEMTREEMKEKLKLAHREYFRKFYLKPSIEADLIEMTIPGKPNSKHQKYRLTEKGNRIRRELEAGSSNPDNYNPDNYRGQERKEFK